MPTSTNLMEEVRKNLGPQLDALVQAAVEKDRASRGSMPGVDVAERMAERARELQEQSPNLSNLAAVTRAYREAAIPMG